MSMAKKYVLQSSCSQTQQAIYLRDISWIGVHATYRLDDAKRMSFKEARELRKETGERYKVTAVS